MLARAGALRALNRGPKVGPPDRLSINRSSALHRPGVGPGLSLAKRPHQAAEPRRVRSRRSKVSVHALKLFGGISLRGASGPVAGAASQRRRLALLALLAAAPGRTLSRDKVIGLLWPESNTVKARHLLADAIYELRAGLGKHAIEAIGDDLILSG